MGGEKAWESSTNRVDQAPCANTTAPPDLNACIDDSPGPDPAIILDDDGPAQRGASTAGALARVDRVGGADEFDPRTEYAAVADLDGAAVRETTVRPDEDVISDLNVVAVVTVEGRLDYHTLAAFAHGLGHRLRADLPVGERRLRTGLKAQDLSEEANAFLGAGAVGRIGRVVEAPIGCYASLAILDKCWGVGKVIVAGQHFLPLN